MTQGRGDTEEAGGGEELGRLKEEKGKKGEER